MVQSPLGKSGVSGKGLMSISVNKTTEYPNPSLALAQFYEPAEHRPIPKQVAVYPSSPSAYDDAFFYEVPSAIEAAADHRRRRVVATYADIVPTVPNKANIFNQIVLAAVQSALFDEVPAPGRPEQGSHQARQAPDQEVAHPN